MKRFILIALLVLSLVQATAQADEIPNLYWCNTYDLDLGFGYGTEPNTFYWRRVNPELNQPGYHDWEFLSADGTWLPQEGDDYRARPNNPYLVGELDDDDGDGILNVFDDDHPLYDPSYSSGDDDDDDEYNPDSTSQDNDNDGEPNATDTDDDNDKHLDADGDPDADGDNIPDDLEDLVEFFGDATMKDSPSYIFDDNGDLIYDENGNTLMYQFFAYKSFAAGYAHDEDDPNNIYYTYTARLADSGRAYNSQEGILEWRLCCDVCPNGAKYYYWEFFNPDVCGGKWTKADRSGVVPDSVPGYEDLTVINSDSVDIDADPDGDGDSTAREAANNTNPMNEIYAVPALPDSDGDSWSDEEEVKYGSNIYDSAAHPVDDGDYWDTTLSQQSDLSGDWDGDGYSNKDEAASGTSPTNHYDVPADDDNDGRPNAVERVAGTNPNDASSKPVDTYTVPATKKHDTDGDGYSNQMENEQGTDPSDPESTPEGEEEDMTEDDNGESTETFDWDAVKDKTTEYVSRVTDCFDFDALKQGTANTSFIIKYPVDIDDSLSITWKEWDIPFNPDSMPDGAAKTVAQGSRTWIKLILSAILIFLFTYKLLGLIRATC